MKESTKKRLKRVGIVAGIAIGVPAVSILGYVLLHKPVKVEHPCKRTFTRADGIPKKAFDSAIRANWQSVVQLFCHGEVCNSYEAKGKFYTGHSKNSIIRSIKVA